MRALPPILIAVLALSACSESKSAENAGPSGSRSFALSGFDAVSLSGPDNVKIVEGAAFAVTATGPQKILDKLDISVDGTKLKIGRERSANMLNWESGKGVLVTVTMPVIRRAAIGGSGDMTVDAPATGDFEGAIGGSGDLRISKVAATSLSLSIGGSGDIQAAGTTQTGEFSIAGSGNIDASKVTAKDIEASIAGSGDITANATGTVSASLVGSGDVTVKGTEDCSVSKVGSGEVLCTK